MVARKPPAGLATNGPTTKAGRELMQALEEHLPGTLTAEKLVTKAEREGVAHVLIALVRSGIVMVEREARKGGRS